LHETIAAEMRHPILTSIVLGFPFSPFVKMPAKSDGLEWIWNPLQNA
jgi:hypothetical protein